MTIALYWYYPPAAITIVALQKVGLVSGGCKYIVAQILYGLATIGAYSRFYGLEKPLQPPHRWLVSYRSVRLSR